MQKEILGTIYTEASADFQRGIYPIARTIKAENHDLAVVYKVRKAETKVRRIGNIYSSEGQNGNIYSPNGISPALLSGETSTSGNGGIGNNNAPKIIDSTNPLGNLNGHKLGSGYADAIYDVNAYSPTINTMGVGQTPIFTERKEDMAKVGQISSDGSQCSSVFSDNGSMATITAGTHGYANPHIYTKHMVRKLTPLECWRLMDFTDEDFSKAEDVNSNSQLYKQAGNSIVKNVLMAIFGQMIP